MKSAFLGNEQTIAKVFSPRVITELVQKAGLESDRVLTRADILADPERTANVEYIFSTWGMPAFDRDEVRAFFPALKAVFYAAGSVQSFARPFLENGVAVFSAWAANAVPVAEYTTAQIILANKGYFQACRKTVSPTGRADASAYSRKFPGTYGCSVGIIGAGMIGSMVIDRLKRHEMRVLVYDPFLSPENAADMGVEMASLEEIFSSCQTISNHVANNPSTVHMFDYRLFSRMKDNATFINTGRGAQVVENDLIRALREQPNRTAVLDVTLPEPPNEDSPLYVLPNVILTPHIAGSTGDEVMRMGVYMLDEFERFHGGQHTHYQVTLQMLKTMA